MCGIAGKLTLTREAGVRRSLLRAMTDVLAHRGPGAAGYYAAPGIGFGWRHHGPVSRPGSDDPPASEDGTIRAVADCGLTNGRELRAELKARGHRLCGTTAAEVIVHGYEEWHDDVLQHLRGAFALALWDGRRQRLLLARDRLGIKPLFYHVLADGVVFASELKALLEDADVPRECDLTAIDQYLALQYVPSPGTILRDVRKMPAGHCAIADHHGTAVHEYWDLPWWDNRHLQSEREYLEEAAAAARDAVRAELREGAQPPVLLSGGIASAALAATVAAIRDEQVVTLTAGFDEAPFDALDCGRGVARALESRHYSELVAARADDLLPHVAWHLDEPLGDPSAIAAYCRSAAARRHTNTVLAGYGGLQTWGGLPRHVSQRRALTIRRWLGPFTWEAALLGHVLPRRVPGAALLRSLRLSPARSAAQAQLTSLGRRRLLTADFVAQTRPTDPLEPLYALYHAYPSPDPIARALYMDAKSALADSTLAIVDRAAAAASLDVRMPLLDSRLVEVTAMTPIGLRLRGRHGSFLLRQLAGGRVPEASLRLEHDDLGPRLAAWLRGPLAPMVSDLVLSGRFRQRGLCRARAVTRLWQEHLTGHRDHHRVLWSLLMLELWFRQFTDGARRLERAA